MAQVTNIGWTDVSWNPVHGCSKVSPGCAHCYAETLSLRYGHTKKSWTPANAAENVLLKPHKLREPLSNAKPWDKPCLVFVNSMSDLFHELVPDEYIWQVYLVMVEAERHTFQVLTKRPERMRDLLRSWNLAQPAPNVWWGTSIENRRFVDRADALRDTPAAVRFISAEPLLGPLMAVRSGESGTSEGEARGRTIGTGLAAATAAGPGRLVTPPQPIGSLDLTDIDWLIVGGESGPGHRPIQEDWVRDLRDACFKNGRVVTATTAHSADGSMGEPVLERGTAFFFKQWGGARPTSGGRELDGQTWDEMPVQRAVIA